jgi:hypothetical protein
LRKEERDRYMLEIEGLKIKLREFCLSLRSDNDLKEYKDKSIIECDESGHIHYVSYQNQKDHAYDPQTGFLEPSKRPLSNAAIF